ncbi:MAG: 3-oxo-5-alpha-steroid 4-dehydrogenase, partial [Bacteroidales bacterium]|nr:3-oxo-5-alpha-steroid 4-dehydrogenase [Bacteroidales bacterium]
MQTFYIFLAVMALLAVVVFFGLYRVDAGYGKF